MKQFWDERYKEAEYVYGTEPNDFFREKLAELNPGKLLLPGEGEGRNAAWAASQNWEVFAFDYSTEGKAKAESLAKARKVSINYRVEPLGDFQFVDEQYDAAGLFFFHAPVPMRQLLHRGVERSLRPGGVLILEGFHKDQINRNSGGPGNLELLFSEDELIDDFPQMEILELRHTLRKLSEGPLHQGEAEVLQLKARKIMG